MPLEPAPSGAESFLAGIKTGSRQRNFRAEQVSHVLDNCPSFSSIEAYKPATVQRYPAGLLVELLGFVNDLAQYGLARIVGQLQFHFEQFLELVRRGGLK